MAVQKIIRSYAPVRVCDLGGWTDTWFAEKGAVTNIAVDPGVECIIRVHDEGDQEPITIFAENFGEKFVLGEGKGYSMIEAAVGSMPLPTEVALEISVFSEIPPGASMGTSAAVLVALIGALDLLTPGQMSPFEIARKAHDVEVTTLKRQSGVQDQIASSFGGLNFIEVIGYPVSNVSPVRPSDRLLWELESRLVTFFLGRGHDSSQTHEQVIRACEQGTQDARLQRLREIADEGKNALYAEDITAFGRAMNANLSTQRELHPDLVGQTASELIEIATEFEAIGAKVNGAGGDGGTVTILSTADPVIQRQMVATILTQNPEVRVLPTRLNQTGLRRWVAVAQ
ncbi:MAG: GHMP kinase [Armatimonadetes bacterium]|nr:GHMP kinase [Armatimonadota bacterium]